MDLLEHSFEAVFRLYSLPEAPAATGAAAWTCLAAVLAAAAAAGLWRLRSSTPPVMSMATTEKPLEDETSRVERSPEQARSSPSERPTPESTSAPAPSPKERYTAYYYDSGCVGCCDVGGDEEDEVEEQDPEDDDGEFEPSETGPFGWEVVRSLPLGATETGRHRSSTALNGSVVRLWDQGAAVGLTAAASPRRRGRVGVVAAFF